MRVRIRVDVLYVVALVVAILAIPVMLSANTFFGSMLGRIDDVDKRLAGIEAALNRGYMNVSIVSYPVCREWAEAQLAIDRLITSLYYSYTVEDFATDYQNLVNTLPESSISSLNQAYHYIRAGYGSFTEGDYFAMLKYISLAMNMIDYVANIYDCRQ